MIRPPSNTTRTTSDMWPDDIFWLPKVIAGKFVRASFSFGEKDVILKQKIETIDIDTLAEKIWGYHLMHQPLKKADCIFVLGSNDTRIAEHAANLFLQGYAPFIIFSGGLVTASHFEKSEAETFRDIALAKGVPPEKILLETETQNTGENILLSKKLLAEKGMTCNSFILVQKPYMERRTYATFKKQWPGKEFIVTSPPLTFQKYPTPTLTKERTISSMLGDLQRIKEYPAKGFQISQEIPGDVWSAYETLVSLGFSKRPVVDN